ncbi:DUF58 domain-containing protein [Dongia sp.]|uniref:DUF58 domain-containing protein n=1 Tax=Dongia sp. TaxID=1977262 RepID=UPI0035B4864C
MALTGTAQPTPAELAHGRNKAEASAVAERLPPLLLAAERIAATVEQGVHGRRRTGPGEVFWQYRPYYPGDELKRLDWRASAKTDKLYLRQLEWSASQSVYLWCDLSPSMAYASRRDLPTKAARAQVLALALSNVLARAGERVGLLGHPEPPSAGRNVTERLAERLFVDARDPENAPSLPPPADLPAHAHALLISDFLSPLDELQAVIARLAGRNIHGHLLQVLDPAEQSMPFTGRVRFLGLEREGDMLTSRAETIREQYIARLAAHQDAMRDLARHAGWSMTVHVTDSPAAASVLALYQWLAADRRLRR